MKAGIIDILLDAFGWVGGKAALFYLAIFTGAGMGALALLAGMKVGKGFDYPITGDNPIAQAAPGFVVGVPQFALLFGVALWWVRSEKVGVRSWAVIAGVEAALVTLFLLPGISGVFPLIVTMTVLIAETVILAKGVIAFRVLQVRRWEEDAAARLVENAHRREDLLARFGTVNSSAADLGIS